jgi:hypothetical protein
MKPSNVIDFGKRDWLKPFGERQEYQREGEIFR